MAQWRDFIHTLVKRLIFLRLENFYQIIYYEILNDLLQCGNFKGRIK